MSAPSGDSEKKIWSAEQLLETEQPVLTLAEQRKLDQQAYHDATYGRKIVPDRKTSIPYSRHPDDIKALSKKHPTLFFNELHEIWFYNICSVPIEGFVKKEQDEHFNEHVKKEQPSTTTKEKGLSPQQVDEQLQLLRNELESLKSAKKEMEEQKQAENDALKQELETLKKENEKTSQENFEQLVLFRGELKTFKAEHKEMEEQKQAENNALKEELEKLKKEHEKTLAKLKIAEDTAQRDDALEQKLVSLAEAMLVAKRGNEANFKDLKRRVKKIQKFFVGEEEVEFVHQTLMEDLTELKELDNIEKVLNGIEPLKIKEAVDVKGEELQNPVVKSTVTKVKKNVMSTQTKGAEVFSLPDLALFWPSGL